MQSTVLTYGPAVLYTPEIDLLRMSAHTHTSARNIMQPRRNPPATAVKQGNPLSVHYISACQLHALGEF